MFSFLFTAVQFFFVFIIGAAILGISTVVLMASIGISLRVAKILCSC